MWTVGLGARCGGALSLHLCADSGSQLGCTRGFGGTRIIADDGCAGVTWMLAQRTAGSLGHRASDAMKRSVQSRNRRLLL